VDRGLPAGELHDLRLAFEREVEAGAGIGETHGAVEVAGGVDLDEREACVLNLRVGASVVTASEQESAEIGLEQRGELAAWFTC
jgi:hypothetical protein